MVLASMQKTVVLLHKSIENSPPAAFWIKLLGIVLDEAGPGAE